MHHPTTSYVEPGSSFHSQQRLYGEITDEPGGTVRRMAA
jgi:hypothetical protein